MRRKRRGRRKKRNKKILKVMLAILLILIAAIVIFFKMQGSDEEVVEEKEIEQIEETGLSFPYEVADGKIQIDSLFQSSIGNPDFNDEIGENIGSLEFTNISEEYISHVEFVVDLADGQKLNFEAENIPAGKKVWTFELSNMSVQTDIRVENISCDVDFLTEDQLMTEVFAVETEMTEVKISNLTNDEMTDLSIEFHCLFDGVYFGGTSYTYPIDIIQPEETITLQVEECYLGEAEAVRITQKQE